VSETPPGSPAPEVSIDVSNLREVLTAARDYSPALARELRKRLRSSGEEIIAEQRSILDGPLPGNAAKAGSRIKLVVPRDGRAPHLRKVNVYKDVATKRNRSTGMRERIKASLKTRVVAGKSRQGVNVRADTRVGGVMAVQWQARRFRHPVFGTGTFADQKGQPYFWGPAIAGRDKAAERIKQAIDDAVVEATS
jgi:hypothetical protein